MKHLPIGRMFLCTLALILCFSDSDSQWKIPPDAPLLTRWARQVSPAKVHPEYPRPQMVRDQWMNLNGLWQYAEAKEGENAPVGRDLGGTILVPFPIESALSGVMKPAVRLWYRRTFMTPLKWSGQRVILHFGAVDWESRVFVNGKQVGEHRGGYDPFEFDITDALVKNRQQELIVGVFDPTDAGDQPRGKQVNKPHGIMYTSTTGIWQTIWIESVPLQHISNFVATPDIDTKTLRLNVNVSSVSDAAKVRATAYDGKAVVSTTSGKPNTEFSLRLKSMRLWSPANPFLYDLKIELVQDGKVVDAIRSYFGMRKIEVRKDEKGINRIMLNGKFAMEVGPLDQGFWPDGLYTAPTDDAMKSDISWMKRLGFNMVRKHVKVEPERWYYWTDKLGLLVWQDMPSGNNRTDESKSQFETELDRLVQTHRNHPSIIMWVVFNEGWGQYDTERLTDWVKKIDPSRLVNNASGWTDKNAGDVNDIHSYPKPASPNAEEKRAIVLGEFGGLGLALPGHTWQKEHWGYRGMKDKEQLLSLYESFMQRVYALKDDPGLSAAVYTQLTDVETECNGLLTYDRAMVKPDVGRLKKVNEGDFSSVPPPPVVNSLVPTSEKEGQIWKYTIEQPGENWFREDFDDAKWQTGAGGFGTKETPGSVVRTEWKTNNVWIRREFVLKELKADNLYLWMFHDEDAEVYINGVLAVKASDYTTEYEQYDITPEAIAGLKVGKNTIAIHCKQTSGGQCIDAGLVYIRKAQASAKTSQGKPRSLGQVSTVRDASANTRSTLYVTNREPLVPSAFMKLPIGSIKPEGWLRRMLELEKNGMTGHLEEISPWLNWQTSAWANKEGVGQRGWEELPYWLKGYGDLGYALGDKTIIDEARKWIDVILSSQRADGWFGPRALLTSLDGKPDLWPHMVMLNVLQSFYEYAGDQRVLPFMTGYFKWQNQLPGTSFGAGYWPKIRAGDNIESIYWLYNRTGEKWLLGLARKIHDNMARWDNDVIDWHNVNIAQGFREPAVYYMQSGDRKNLDAAERNYRKVMDLYGQFPGGTFAGDENCRVGFTDPRQGFETCGIVEYMHSFEMLTKISGNPLWADRCEDIAFNSLPAALTPDLKALHYLTGANQVHLDSKNKAPGVQNGGTMFSYSPFEVYRCCQHNVSHGWPYYAEELWLGTADNGLCVSLYSASEVKAKVGDGTAMRIVEETDYPFSSSVKLTFSMPKSVKFPLYLRIPRWCKNPSVTINMQNLEVKAEPLSYAIVSRVWSDGDVVSVDLPMNVDVRTWNKNEDAVSVNYGPLTFSLDIGEKWERYGKSDQWPEWEVLPTTPWNYGLDLDPKYPAKSFDVVRIKEVLPTQPFTPENSPIVLRVNARQIPGWQEDYLGLVGKLQPSPALSTLPDELVSLIPMGAARLRISSFPTVASDENAHEWIAPPKPHSVPYKITFSHVYEQDTPDALADGLTPATSKDQSIPRFTWWNHRGTKEWVQYDFDKPMKIEGSTVYWFDDGPDGECRLPQSWNLLVKVGETWKPVENSTGYGIQRDGWNSVKFKSVESTAIRLEAQLLPGYSGGILEWTIE